MAKCRANRGMWPSVRFRIVAENLQSGGDVWRTDQVLAAYFEGTFELVEPLAKVRMQNPRLLEGVITPDEFIALLDSWASFHTASLGQFKVAAPAGFEPALLWWSEDAPYDPAAYPLLDSPPTHQSSYRVDRLVGSGAQLDINLHNDLISAMSVTAESPWGWLRTYGGVPLNDLQSRYVLIQLPLAVAVDADFRPETSTIEVQVHYRRPVDPSQIQVRIGQTTWDGTLPTIEPQSTSDADDGWMVSRYSSVVAPESTGLRKVWVGRSGSQDEFEWEVSVQLGEPDTPELRRRDFVAAWYELSGKKRSLGSGIRPRHPVQHVGEESADALELALANACAGLGWATVFGGTTLKTAGVDLVAFDLEMTRAYPISATISNDIGDKFRGWLRVKAQIESELSPLWRVCPVIITSEPLASCAVDDLREAQGARVQVLVAEDLAWAHEVPPDLTRLQELLRSDPSPLPDWPVGFAHPEVGAGAP